MSTNKVRKMSGGMTNAHVPLALMEISESAWEQI